MSCHIGSAEREKLLKPVQQKICPRWHQASGRLPSHAVRAMSRGSEKGGCSPDDGELCLLEASASGCDALSSKAVCDWTKTDTVPPRESSMWSAARCTSTESRAPRPSAANRGEPNRTCWSPTRPVTPDPVQHPKSALRPCETLPTSSGSGKTYGKLCSNAYFLGCMG